MTYPPPPPTTWRPTRKVTAGALALACWEVVESVLANDLGIDLHEATLTALNVLVPTLVAYLVPEGT